MPGINNFFDQAKQFWISRTGTQRALLLAGAGATALLLTVFTRLIGSPDYKPLFKDLEPADAQTLVAQLDAQNIPHQISADGKTVSVPADKLDAARMQTAAQGEPHSGRMGFELFDKMTWGQTEFDEKVAYQRAMEGELERTIQTLAYVERARVHLVMPTDSVFLDRQRGAKASVILKLKRNGMSKEGAQAISRLVAGAVDQLKPEDVSIVDADTDSSLGIGHSGPGGGDQEQENLLTQRLISTLEPVVGTNSIRATVNIDYDQGSSEESQEKYDPSVTALLSTQKSEDQATGGSIPQGVPGTSSNIPVPKPTPKAGTAAATTPQGNTATGPSLTQGNLQSSKSENSQYGVNKTIVHTITPAGRIERVTAALLIDDEVVKTVRNGKTTFTKQKRSPDELKKIRELAEAAIGFDEKRGDTLSVENMPFDANSAETDLPAVGWTTQVQKAVTDYSSLLRPLSLLALFMMAYLFVLRPIQKQALAPAAAGHGAAQAALASAAPLQPLPAVAVPELGAGNPRAAHLRAQTFELARQKPVDTARAMQAWMREDEA